MQQTLFFLDQTWTEYVSRFSPTLVLYDISIYFALLYK